MLLHRCKIAVIVQQRAWTALSRCSNANCRLAAGSSRSTSRCRSAPIGSPASNTTSRAARPGATLRLHDEVDWQSWRAGRLRAGSTPNRVSRAHFLLKLMLKGSFGGLARQELQVPALLPGTHVPVCVTCLLETVTSAVHFFWSADSLSDGGGAH